MSKPRIPGEHQNPSPEKNSADAKSNPPASGGASADATSPTSERTELTTPTMGPDPTQVLFDALIADRKRKHPKNSKDNEDKLTPPSPEEWGQNGRKDSRLTGLIFLVAAGVLMLGALVWGFFRLAETVETPRGERTAGESPLRTTIPPPERPTPPGEPPVAPQRTAPAVIPPAAPGHEPPREEPPPHEPEPDPVPPDHPDGPPDGDEDGPPDDGHPGDGEAGPDIRPADGEPMGEPID